MRASAVVSEAWRNLRTGTSRALLLTTLLAAVTGLLGIADIMSVHALEQKAEQYLGSGAAIRAVSIDALVDPQSCEALGSATTVRAAGAIAAATPITATALPRSPLPAFTVTPSFATVLGLDPAHASGVWISASLAQTLHAGIGTSLATAEGPLEISGIFAWPDDGRDSRVGSAVLVPDRTLKRFDECWAAVWPTSDETDDLLRFAADPWALTDSAVTVTQVNRNFGTSFEGHAEFLGRSTRHILPVSVVAGFFIAVTSVRLRRLEYAGALHAGQSRAASAAVCLLETLVWSGAGALISTAALVLTARITSLDGGLVTATTGLRAACATMAGTVLGAAISIALVRESHLFRYFKDR